MSSNAESFASCLGLLLLWCELDELWGDILSANPCFGLVDSLARDEWWEVILVESSLLGWDVEGVHFASALGSNTHGSLKLVVVAVNHLLVHQGEEQIVVAELVVTKLVHNLLSGGVKGVELGTVVSTSSQDEVAESAVEVSEAIAYSCSEFSNSKRS